MHMHNHAHLQPFTCTHMSNYKSIYTQHTYKNAFPLIETHLGHAHVPAVVAHAPLVGGNGVAAVVVVDAGIDYTCEYWLITPQTARYNKLHLKTGLDLEK